MAPVPGGGAFGVCGFADQMNAFATNLFTLKDNLHVSVPLFLALACEVGKVWFPGHTAQFDGTQKIFAAYGILAASNSSGTLNKHKDLAPTTPTI